MEFTVSKADLPEEKEAITKFLKNNFFSRLNIVKMFGLEDEPPPDIPDIATFVVKAEDKHKQLIGVAFNTTTPTNTLWDKNKSEKERQLVDFFEYFEKQCRLKEVEGTVELWLMTVAVGWERHGVGLRLAKESVRLAKALGYQYITTSCANEKASRLAQAVGFREYFRIRYLDYSRLPGRRVHLIPTPPDHTLYFYVKDLQTTSKL